MKPHRSNATHSTRSRSSHSKWTDVLSLKTDAARSDEE